MCQERIRIALPWSLRSDHLELFLPRWPNAWCSCHVLSHSPCLEWAMYTTIVWWVKLKASLVNCGCPLAKDTKLQRHCVQTSFLHSWDFMVLSLRLEKKKELCWVEENVTTCLFFMMYSWDKIPLHQTGFMFNYKYNEVHLCYVIVIVITLCIPVTSCNCIFWNLVKKLYEKSTKGKKKHYFLESNSFYYKNK